MKRLLSLVLALVMLLGILAGCGVPAKAPTETVHSTTETTASAEASTPTQKYETDTAGVIHPADIIIDTEQQEIFDFGGSFIPPVQLDLSMLTDEELYQLSSSYRFIVRWYYPCNKEDALQCGANFAQIMLEGKDKENYDKLLQVGTDTFERLSRFYTMDDLYSWVLVGIFNPDILLDFFSGEFSEEPDPLIIKQVQEWIPNILDLCPSPELIAAIDQNPWFEVQHLSEEG